MILATSACNPRLFNILEGSPSNMVSIYYNGNLDGLSKLNDNSLALKDSLLVSLKFIGSTNHVIEFNTEHTTNPHYYITFRTIFDNYNKHKGIYLAVNHTEYFVYSLGQLIKQGVLNKHENYFKIEDDGKYLKLKINCDDIIIENKYLYSSEYMIIENMNGSSFNISGLSWKKINY